MIQALTSLIHEQTFKDNLDPKIFHKLKIIQKVGNIAAHSHKALTDRDSLHVIQELFHFLYWLYRFYSTGEIERDIIFNADLIPSPKKLKLKKYGEPLKQIQEKEADLLTKEQLIKEAEEKLIQIQQNKEQNKQIPDNYDYNEAETREYFIDVLLKESGWDVKAKNAVNIKSLECQIMKVLALLIMFSGVTMAYRLL